MGPSTPVLEKKKVSSGQCVPIHMNTGDYALNLGAGKPGMLIKDPTMEKAGAPSPASSSKFWILFDFEGK